MEHANLYGAHLDSADLFMAQLSGAYLDSAHLEHANLLASRLDNAVLSHSSLLHSRNITVEQLFNVKSLYWTKLDDSLTREIKKKYPELMATVMVYSPSTKKRIWQIDTVLLERIKKPEWSGWEKGDTCTICINPLF
ncbi:MAG TPA: pentapeptide repeat-containing protein [Chitinispirillaceae bacterium]|nr:pentapeptide repeat-containing protein [Chitinispirillaceae bacterium]